MGYIRDGPKFGECRSSAEEFGRMFGSVRFGSATCDYSAEVRPNLCPNFWYTFDGRPLPARPRRAKVRQKAQQHLESLPTYVRRPN